MKDEEATELTGQAGERSLEHVERTLDRFLAVPDVGKAFGEPIRQGDTTIVPAAEVMTAMGIGVGFGGGSEDGREGGGGGGTALARPVAAGVAAPRGGRVEPVLDVTKIARAAITAGGFMLATWLGMSRPKKPRLG